MCQLQHRRLVYPHHKHHATRTWRPICNSHRRPTAAWRPFSGCHRRRAEAAKAKIRAIKEGRQIEIEVSFLTQECRMWRKNLLVHISLIKVRVNVQLQIIYHLNLIRIIEKVNIPS